MDLRLHFLEAAGSLAPWRRQMQIEAEAVSSRADVLICELDRRQPVDVLIRYAFPVDVIPEIGLGGMCYGPNLISIDLAPDSDRFAASVEKGEFGNSLAHELHHAIRYQTCGYGDTLGKALVSEGLADHFAVEVTGCEPPPWTQVSDLPASVILQGEAELDALTYDHQAWFFGRKGLPRWAGYTMGWRIVAAYLKDHPEETAGTLVGNHAAPILKGGWGALRARMAA